MNNTERVKEFLKELSELTKKHKLVIGATWNGQVYIYDASDMNYRMDKEDGYMLYPAGAVEYCMKYEFNEETWNNMKDHIQ
jgi:hypothetical protein